MKILRLLVIALAVVGLCSIVAAIYMLPKVGLISAGEQSEEPTVTFIRLSHQAVQQEALFSTPCDPGGPHLYVGDGEDLRLPLFLRWPSDLPDLEQSDYAAPGNRFLLEGYPVARTTGEAITPALYFDVTAWSPMPPYRRWHEVDDEVTEEADVDEPVTFRSSETNATFKTSSYSGGGC